MAKLLNSLNFNKPIAKIIELPEHYAINGQIYSKDGMTPIPLQFYVVPSSPKCEMSLNKTGYIESGWARSRIDNNVVIDNIDPTISYFCTQGLIPDGSACVHKCITNSNGTIRDFTNYTLGSSYKETVEIFSQDDINIYASYTRETSTTAYNSGVLTYNKSSMSAVDCSRGSSVGQLHLLKDTNSCTYFYTHHATSPSAYIVRFDKSDGKFTNIYSESNSKCNEGDYIPTPLKSNGDFYIVRDAFAYNDSDHYILYMKYNFNDAKNLVTSQQVTVDMSNHPVGKIPYTANSASIAHELIEYSENGERFITHIIYNRGNRVLLPKNESAMYTYRIIDDNNWEFISETIFEPVVYKVSIPLFNGTAIALAFERGCYVYSWDSAERKYIKTVSYEGEVQSVGCDSSNNVYIHFKDGSIEMISNVIPTTIYCDFKENDYIYDGDVINTSIVVSAKNLSRKYLNCNLQVQLFGNVKFTDTGEKTKMVSTSNNGNIEIPVTITDTGILKTSARMI